MTVQSKPIPIHLHRDVVTLLSIFKRIAERVAQTQPRKSKATKA